MGTTIRRSAEVLQLLPCAILVFICYMKMGYYPSWLSAKFAVGSYYKEKNKLGAEVLIEYLWGFIPIGTLMCSIDKGWLPVDEIFTENMHDIRHTGACIGYFGKFGILPSRDGIARVREMISRARTWGIKNGIERVVVIVNPKHVGFYIQIGFTPIAHSIGTTPGLAKALPVLMSIDVDLPHQFRKNETKIRGSENESSNNFVLQ